jgi:hypothetical protein
MSVYFRSIACISSAVRLAPFNRNCIPLSPPQRIPSRRKMMVVNGFAGSGVIAFTRNLMDTLKKNAFKGWQVEQVTIDLVQINPDIDHRAWILDYLLTLPSRYSMHFNLTTPVLIIVTLIHSTNNIVPRFFIISNSWLVLSHLSVLCIWHVKIA